MAVLKQIPFRLEADRLMREAQVPSEPEDIGAFRRLVDLAQREGRPKAAFAVCFIENREGDRVRIGGETFESRVLSRSLAKVERVFPVVTTCGTELDDVFQEQGDVLYAYWWDRIKTELLVAAEQALGAHLRQHFQLRKTAVLRPGASDALVWPIEAQRGLFALLGDRPAQIGVRLTDSFLMTPNKTASGLLFPTETNYHECEVCHREGCPSRRAPFSSARWEQFGLA